MQFPLGEFAFGSCISNTKFVVGLVRGLLFVTPFALALRGPLATNNKKAASEKQPLAITKWFGSYLLCFGEIIFFITKVIIGSYCIRTKIHVNS